MPMRFILLTACYNALNCLKPKERWESVSICPARWWLLCRCLSGMALGWWHCSLFGDERSWESAVLWLATLAGCSGPRLHQRCGTWRLSLSQGESGGYWPKTSWFGTNKIISYYDHKIWAIFGSMMISSNGLAPFSCTSSFCHTETHFAQGGVPQRGGLGYSLQLLPGRFRGGLRVHRAPGSDPLGERVGTGETGELRWGKRGCSVYIHLGPSWTVMLKTVYIVLSKHFEVHSKN